MIFMNFLSPHLFQDELLINLPPYPDVMGPSSSGRFDPEKGRFFNLRILFDVQRE